MYANISFIAKQAQVKPKATDDNENAPASTPNPPTPSESYLKNNLKAQGRPVDNFFYETFSHFC